MKAVYILAYTFLTLVGVSAGAFPAEAATPCEKPARRLFREVTGSAPSQFALSLEAFSQYADAKEFVYVAANDLSDAYVLRYFHLDGRKCFLHSMQYDGDL